MKKLLFFAMVIFTNIAIAQKAAQSPTVKSESETVKVTYGQPSKRGREIFGKLVPFGEVWRTGANAATEITFTKDVEFGSVKVAAGTYSLFTIPNQGEWTVILNSQLKQWGAYAYDKIKTSNVAEFKIKTNPVAQEVEKMTITAANNSLSIAWDKTEVVIPIH